jgi:glycosyltransferase involved in cell wall biosynthesis
VIIDIYGPLFDDIPVSLFDQNPRISFKGPIAHVDVIPTMKQYDAFVFPTHHEGEGYPGVILEAYNAGLPVIASDWRAIPEIVDEYSGVLVRPKDPGALAQAMQTLADDPELFTRLRHGAREKANQFSSAYWAKKFLEYCIEKIS